MTEHLQLQLSDIQNRIYTFRNQKVMLDFDLAEMYGVQTKVLNQAIKRNIGRFPIDFMFQLTKIEFDNLRSQFVTSSWGGKRYPPFAFTEQGVAMLASVLKSETAIQVNIAIVRAFVAIRQSLFIKPNDKLTELQSELKELKDYINEVFTDYNDINEDTRMQLELINQSLAELHTDKKMMSKPRNKIGFSTEK
jgi:phage regulator Rha-like protein